MTGSPKGRGALGSRRPLSLSAYLLASHLAGPLAGPILRRRERRGKEDAARLPERMGHAGVARPEGRLIWLHGASVGEAMSMLPLIEALKRNAPDVSILVTTGTLTSAKRIVPLLPNGAQHQFVPVDTSGAVRRFLDHWRPDLAIWIESELWPALIEATHARAVPMALINARVSEKSARSWARAPAMARTLLSRFSLRLTQDEETAARMLDVGVAAEFAGNLKALIPMPDADPAALAAVGAAIGDRPVWLAASTHDGEEVAVLEAHDSLPPGTLLILAPRHPERAEAIDRAYGPFPRRSAGAQPTASDRVWLADTLGEMGLWYRAAPVTFVGGSLVPAGGHTPFEPILCGSAILHGSGVGNFAPAYSALLACGGAIAVEDGAALGRAIARLLDDAPARATMVAAAAGAHDSLRPDVQGITERLMTLMRAR